MSVRGPNLRFYHRRLYLVQPEEFWQQPHWAYRNTTVYRTTQN